MTPSLQPLHLHYWAQPDLTDQPPQETPVFMQDSDDLPERLNHISVVLATGDETRARELIARGAERVLLGDAALHDGALVARLAQALGSERIGVWLPVRRMAVSWALDFESNADFRCITPSLAKPAWEILDGKSQGTGTDALWWLDQMLAQGASLALLAVDLGDDHDLNLCAELMEQHPEQVYLSALDNPQADLTPWVAFGQARHLVVPPDYDDQALLALNPTVTEPQEACA